MMRKLKDGVGNVDSAHFPAAAWRFWDGGKVAENLQRPQNSRGHALWRTAKY
jgi:hypothetical protein